MKTTKPKKKIGKPLMFATPAILAKKIDDYFIQMEKEDEIPTVTGLAVHLDTNRRTLLNYSDKPEYVHSIKRATTRCELAIERGMLKNKINPASAIFNLKNNYGWKDQTVSEVTNTHMHLHGVAKGSYEEADKRQVEQDNRLTDPYSDD